MSDSRRMQLTKALTERRYEYEKEENKLSLIPLALKPLR